MISDCELTAAREIIRRGLVEDLRYGPDVTTLATVPAEAVATASMVPRQPGVIAGVDIALLVLDEVLGARGYQVLDRVEDGAHLQPGQSLLTVRAETRGLLTAERTMLNLICHLSGIATTTAHWVAAVQGTKAQVRDTRKTLPGLRALQKYAVRVGGGVNHRLGLGDAALIKDNHVVAAGSVVDALRAVRDAAPSCPARWRSTRSSSSTRCCRKSPNWCCWTTSRCGRRRWPCSGATRARPRSCSSPPAASAWRTPPTTPRPGWITWPSAR